MKLGVLFSGGKDSCYATYNVLDEHEVVCLITLVSKNDESYMFHTPNIDITSMQAEAIGLPILSCMTEGVKEEELTDLKDVIKLAVIEYGIEGVVTGAIASKYQAERIKNICSDLGIECINPLWGIDQVKLLHDLVAEGFDVMICGVFAYGLNEDLLGSIIDEDVIRHLVDLKEKYQVNPSGEGGEIETTVLNAPYFNKQIIIDESKIRKTNDSGIYVITKAHLEDN